MHLRLAKSHSSRYYGEDLLTFQDGTFGLNLIKALPLNYLAIGEMWHL